MSRRPGRGIASGGPRPGPVRTFTVGPGYPWPIVTAAAVVVVGLLGWLLGHRGGVVGLLFPIGFLGVSVLGTMMVRLESVLAAVLAAPVVAFLGLVVAAVVGGAAASGSSLLLGVLVPLAELFWWMLGAVVACAVVGSLRVRRARPDRSLLDVLRDPAAP